MFRGLLIAWLLLVVAAPGNALAASDIQLKHAPDGTLVVTGSGWHRDQALVIDLGQQQFSVRADTSGDFELATGLASYSGELSVHHPSAPPDMAFMALGSPAPHPFAVLFAWSVAEGIALLGMIVGVALIAAGIKRRLGTTR